VIDVIRLTLAEQRLQQRIREDLRVEGVLEPVQSLLAPGVLVERRHQS
jgi:hypothetical protein